MIQTYIGEGLTSLAEKLQELWSFKRVETDDAGVVDLWISDEICISLTASLCTVQTTAFSSIVNPISGATDTYHWKIIQTNCGIAFGPESMAYVFIGRTVRFDGVESMGCIARPYGTVSYTAFADSQAGLTSVSANNRFTKSEHYTQLYPATCPSANVYFPDIYFIAQSPQATNRITQIGADIYFCNEFLALRDTPAQTGTGGESVDLSAYYTGAQVDAKIRVVEQVIAELETDLREEITSVAQSVTALDNSLRAEVKSVEQSVSDLDNSLHAVSENADAAIAYSKTVYVDSAMGSDSNLGTETAPFLTLEKAIAEAIKHRACIINLAGGTYPTTAAIDIRGSCALRIYGMGTSDNPTIINGRISVGSGAYLTLGAIAFACATTTANGIIFAWEGGRVYLTDCTLTPTGGYAINANTVSSVYAANCTFAGTPVAIARTLGGSQITLRNCTDSTGTGALCQNVGRLELNGSSAITYKASGTGFVSVDSIQRYPIDLSAMTAATSE